MLNQRDIDYLTAVCSMSSHHGSYHYLVEGHDGWCYLSHRPNGHIIYEFPPVAL